MNKLWVDDIRRPPEGQWIWARTNEDAKEALAVYYITEISMDHDMGHHDRDPDDEDSIFLRGDAEEDGTELAKWMIEFGLVPQKVTIHSWNPDGAKRMANLLRPHCLTLVEQPYQP